MLQIPDKLENAFDGQFLPTFRCVYLNFLLLLVSLLQTVRSPLSSSPTTLGATSLEPTRGDFVDAL